MASGLEDQHVHVVGLGLMGGSLAMALGGQVRCITAEDLLPGVLEDAQARGVIDGPGRASDADIVVLAIPAHAIAALLPGLALRPGALVIDLGSTKTRICEALDRLPDTVQAVGGHPMCGLAENGYVHAIPTVYRDARFVLCETKRTTRAARARAEALVRALGAQPLWMDRVHHDRLTALSSHLPHLLSFALMRLAMAVADGDPALYELAAGGFDGATRLARTDAAMITGMFSTNAESLREATARLREQLEALEGLLEDEDSLQRELGAIVAARRQYTATHGERLIT